LIVAAGIPCGRQLDLTRRRPFFQGLTGDVPAASLFPAHGDDVDLPFRTASRIILC
jgi:hypothetical protein